MQENTRDLAMVFSGGNAIGAYHAGAYEVLHGQGLRPHWVVGASIGAVTAAILAGNSPEDRIAKLKMFWDEATQATGPSPDGALKRRQVYNGMHALLALAWGRPSVFGHRVPGAWSALPWVPNDVALFDNAPLLLTLERLIDFDRLNQGGVRLTIACVDVETGEEIYFDTDRDVVRPEHILASTAIMPAFPPVEIDGRVLCDAGYTNNLPLDPIFQTEPAKDLLCIASDLFSLSAPRPASLDAVLERANDLIFASAPRRAIAGLRREYDLREKLDPNGAVVTLLHLGYQAGADELAAKSFDFSPSSIQDRWAAGGLDAIRGLESLNPGRSNRSRFEYIAVGR